MKYSKKETAQLIMNHGKELETRGHKLLWERNGAFSELVWKVYLFNRKIYLVKYRLMAKGYYRTDNNIIPIEAEEIEL